MDSLSPNTVLTNHNPSYSADSSLNNLKALGLSQESKNKREAPQVLFRKKDRDAWVVIERKPSSKVKGYLEKANGERERLVLKGVPDRLKAEHIGNAKASLNNNSRISLNDRQIDVLIGLKGGSGKKSHTKKTRQNLETPQYQTNFWLIENSIKDNNPLSLFKLGTKLLDDGQGQRKEIIAKIKTTVQDQLKLLKKKVQDVRPLELFAGLHETIQTNDIDFNKQCAEEVHRLIFLDLPRQRVSEDQNRKPLPENHKKALQALKTRYSKTGERGFTDLFNLLSSNDQIGIKTHFDAVKVDVERQLTLLKNSVESIEFLEKLNQAWNTVDISELEFSRRVSMEMLKKSASLGFVPAHYQLSLREKDNIQTAASYYYEALKQGHWEAARGLLFIDTFDFGTLEVLGIIWNAKNSPTSRQIFERITVKVEEKFENIINRLREQRDAYAFEKSSLEQKIARFRTKIEQAGLDDIKKDYNYLYKLSEEFLSVDYLEFSETRRSCIRRSCSNTLPNLESARIRIQSNLRSLKDLTAVIDISKYRDAIVQDLDYLNKEENINQQFSNSTVFKVIEDIDGIIKIFENKKESFKDELFLKFRVLDFKMFQRMYDSAYLEKTLELISAVIFSENSRPLYQQCLDTPSSLSQRPFEKIKIYCIENLDAQISRFLENFTTADFYNAAILAAELGLENLSHYLASQTQEPDYCYPILYSKLALAAFEKRLIDIDINTDIIRFPEKFTEQNRSLRDPEGAYYPKNIKKSRAFVKEIHENKLKYYTYLQLADLASQSNEFDSDEKLNLVRELVKSANQGDELAFYLLFKASAENEGDDFKISKEYAKKSGWLEKFANQKLEKITILKQIRTKEIKFPERILSAPIDNLLSEVLTYATNPKLSNRESTEAYIIQLCELRNRLRNTNTTFNEAETIFTKKFPTFLWLKTFSDFELGSMRQQWLTDFNVMENNNKFVRTDYKEEDYASLSKKISAETTGWIKKVAIKIIDNLEQTIGKSPPNFSMFTMGSLAREESGPYTDFEVGILLEKNTIEAQEYFSFFTQQLADCLYLLGEHPETGKHGVHLDLAKNAPPHKGFTSRSSGSRIYLTDYESFARLFNREEITIFSRILHSKDDLSQLICTNVKEILSSVVECFDEKDRVKKDERDRFIRTFSQKVFKPFEFRYKGIKDHLLNLASVAHSIKDPLLLEKAYADFISKSVDNKKLIKLIFEESQNQAYKQHSKNKLPHIKAITDLLREDPKATLANPDEIGTARNVKDFARNIKCICSYYNENLDENNLLFNNFAKLRKVHLNETYLTEHSRINLSQEQAISIKAIKDILDCSKKVGPLFDSQQFTSHLGDYTLPKKIDLKRQFYRIPEQLLTGLHCFYKAFFNEKDRNIQNSRDIIKNLKEYGIFSKMFAKDFQVLINITNRLRLKHQFDFSNSFKGSKIYFDEVLWKTDLEESKERVISNLHLSEKENHKFLRNVNYLKSIGPNWLSSTQNSQENKEWEIKNFSIAFNKLIEIIKKTVAWVQTVESKTSQDEYIEVIKFGGSPKKVKDSFTCSDSNPRRVQNDPRVIV